MAWFSLVIAGLLEAFAVAMINQLRITTRPLQTILLIIIGFAVSFSLLSYSLQTISMGTGYAVWTGIGIVGGVLVGMIFYGESSDWRRISFVSLIIVAVIGLRLIS